MSRSPKAETDTLPLPGAAPPPPAEPLRLHGLGFQVAAFSEQGPRPENQDAYTVEAFAGAGLLAVADGMGGELGGRLAADTALRAVLEAGPIRSLDDARRSVRAADRAVAAAAQQDVAGRSGMGCALGVLALAAPRGDGPTWIGAHVGDVRILSRSPDGATRLETRDHTPAFARWEAGEIGLDEIPEAEGANRLQRAVGRGGEADATWLPARPGWTYAIVSDGVTKAMRVDEIGAALAAPTAAEAAELIRRKVEERGADDNFTAVVVRVVGEGASSAAPGASATARPATRSSPVVTPPRRSLATVAIGMLSLLALLAAGGAFWVARETREAGADRAAVERLQQEVEMLRARLNQLEQPFGPAEGAAPPGEN